MHALIHLILFTIAICHCDAEEWSEFSAVLKPSPIHGIGVFATHDIQKGTRVFADLNYRWYELDSIPVELRKYCQFLTEDKVRGPERFDRMEVDWFLNHSNNPNMVEIKEEEWIAVKDIKAGEELLIDYAQLNEPEHLKESFYKNSEGTISAMNTQQKSEFLSNLSHRYVNFINNIGSGNDSQGVEAPILFSENCRKNFNGRWVASDRDSFVNDLVSVYQNYGIWKLIPIDIITAYESEKIILRINIESKSFGNNTAIVILRYNSDYLIEEILEVFSPVQNGYNFNGHKAGTTTSDV